MAAANRGPPPLPPPPPGPIAVYPGADQQRGQYQQQQGYPPQQRFLQQVPLQQRPAPRTVLWFNELTRISDITPPVTLTEDYCRQQLSTYEVWTLQKVDDSSNRIPSRSSKENKKEKKSPENSKSPTKTNTPQASGYMPLWKRVYSKVAEYKRKAIKLVLNGKECLARPDSGAYRNIMTEDFAREHGVDIQRRETVTFKLGTGGCVRSVGRVLVPLRLVGGGQSEKRCWFDVLSKCAVPLIMGMDFLQEIQLYTKNKHLLVDCSSLGDMPSLKLIGSPKGQIDFTANGDALCGCVDTGSDLDLMSLHCAMKNGYKIDKQPSTRTRVMLADRTIVETVGQVHISSISLSSYENFEMTFQVLPNLVCDVIFGEEFLEQMDAFNTCDIVDSEDFDIFSLNTLINLGPIQSFLNRKWTLKANDKAQITHDKDILAEIYRRNKAKKVISKIRDGNRAAIARADEENAMKAFENRHVSCRHCVGALEEGKARESLGGRT